MKFVVAVVALLSVISRVSAVSIASCSVSGDPHWTTFDGVYHDFQGQGTFVLAENHMVTVQYTTARCNLAAPTPVTCVVYVTVGFYDPSDRTGQQPPDIVQYGNFLGQITPLKIQTCPYTPNPTCTTTTYFPANYPSATNPITIADGNVNVYWEPTNQWIVIQNSGQSSSFYGIGNQPFNIVIGDVMVALNFPKIEPWMFSTVGLCGYFNGNPADDFSNSTLFQYLTSAAAQRFNGAVVNLWANNFAVYTNGPNAPLTLVHHKYWNEEGFLVSGGVTVPKPLIPTPSQQAAMDALLFPSLSVYETFQAMCQSVTNTDAAFQNCMYDAAAVPDIVTVVSPTQNMTKSSWPVAQSNGQVESIAQIVNPLPPTTVTNTVSNNGLAIGLGVGLGGAALIALIVAIVYWNRYRFVEAQYSKALIQLNGGGSSKSTKGQADIPLADNL
jgi:hypothetical protein